MMKRIKSFAVLAMALLAFASCKEKDYTAYPPTWKGFRLERNGQEVSNRSEFKGEDTVKVTAVQGQKGRYINSTYYNWSLTCQVYAADGTYKDSTLTKQYHTNYDGTDNGDPKHTFVIPRGAQGRATISFHATYNYSSDGIKVWDGSNVGAGSSSSFSGTIISTSGILSGDAQGSVSFNIK